MNKEEAVLQAIGGIIHGDYTPSSELTDAQCLALFAGYSRGEFRIVTTQGVIKSLKQRGSAYNFAQKLRESDTPCIMLPPFSTSRYPDSHKPEEVIAKARAYATAVLERNT